MLSYLNIIKASSITLRTHLYKINTYTSALPQNYQSPNELILRSIHPAQVSYNYALILLDFSRHTKFFPPALYRATLLPGGPIQLNFIYARGSRFSFARSLAEFHCGAQSFQDEKVFTKPERGLSCRALLHLGPSGFTTPPRELLKAARVCVYGRVRYV